MSTEMLIRKEHRGSQTPPIPALPPEKDELEAAVRHARRRRRLKISVAAWVLGAILFTTLWVVNEWQANGAFESFGHEGADGQWNPTLWALAVGIWGLMVGIMALRVYFDRPATAGEVDREVERLAAAGAPTDAELRRFARTRLERVRRLRFHVAAWAVGMLVLTPLWALIEWQDNGGFERWSNNSQPGDWEPWILYIGGIWALVIAIRGLLAYVERPTSEAEIEREVERLRSGK